MQAARVNPSSRRRCAPHRSAMTAGICAASSEPSPWPDPALRRDDGGWSDGARRDDGASAGTTRGGGGRLAPFFSRVSRMTVNGGDKTVARGVRNVGMQRKMHDQGRFPAKFVRRTGCAPGRVSPAPETRVATQPTMRAPWLSRRAARRPFFSTAMRMRARMSPSSVLSRESTSAFS